MTPRCRMLSIVALVFFILGLIIFGQTPEKRVFTEIGKMMMWCGFLVMLALAGSWHAVPLR